VKRVLLVNSNRLRSPYPVPPLGLCLMASVLEGSYEVRVIDGAPREPEGWRGVLDAFAPDYVGLGIRNIDNVVMDRPEFFLDTIATDFVMPIRAATRAPLILGGAGFTILPDEILSALQGDYGIVGEGEVAFPVLLHALDRGEDPSGIPRVLVRGGIKTLDPASPAPVPPPRIPPAQIDRWIDYAPYRRRGAYPVQIKRGCRHECVYCTYPGIEGRAFRQRSVLLVVDELEAARTRLGDVMFEFVDSTFNDPAGLAETLCREIVERGLDLRLRTMGVNPAHLTTELLTLMRRAGFGQIDFTPDSGSPRVLERLGKGFTRACLERGATLIREHGMPTMWFFLFGGPGECEETIAETFDFIDRFICEEDLVFVGEGLRVYPGAPLHEIAVREKVVEPGQSLLRPCFYVSPTLGRERLRRALDQALAPRLNCLRAAEPGPSPEMIQEASRLRREEGLDEPMFRSLLRVRRTWAAQGRL